MDHSNDIIFTLFLVFSGAAALATIALYARQSLLIAYILLGLILGQSGFRLVENPEFILQISNIGIMFLLFLLGLNLDPKKLIHLIKDTTVITLVSSCLFAAMGYAVGIAFGFGHRESLVVSACMIFSSTIIGLKLLPTTVLHHRHTGELIISVLLLQDLIAILIMLLLQIETDAMSNWLIYIKPLGSLLLLIGFAFAFERLILTQLFRTFDKLQEYLFLAAIGWCLGIAQLATYIGLSHEIGAFIAGVSIATGPISLFIAESLKPLRDFFLVLFFFTLGANFQLGLLGEIILPALAISILSLAGKPLILNSLLRFNGEDSGVSKEVGLRLGQLSEFSILLAMQALALGILSDKTAYIIQMATVITFIVSSYIVILQYPSPIAISDRLRRD